MVRNADHSQRRCLHFECQYLKHFLRLSCSLKIRPVRCIKGEPHIWRLAGICIFLSCLFMGLGLFDNHWDMICKDSFKEAAKYINLYKTKNNDQNYSKLAADTAKSIASIHRYSLKINLENVPVIPQLYLQSLSQTIFFHRNQMKIGFFVELHQSCITCRLFWVTRTGYLGERWDKLTLYWNVCQKKAPLRSLGHINSFDSNV